MEIIKAIAEIAFYAVLLVIGAVMHERDMYNNLKQSGDAEAWTCDIISIEMKETK